jgi:RNA polymerase sigma-32 factor
MADGRGRRARPQSPSDSSSPAAESPFRPLSREEENALAARMRAGDTEAADRLVTSHLPFVTALARRYSRYGLPLNDLVQEGVVGLLQALGRFNPEQNVRLSSFAAWWVRAAIQAHVVRSWSLVRIGTTAAQKSLFFRLRRIAADTRLGMLGRDEAGDDLLHRLAVRFGVSPDELRTLARRISARDRSLNAPAVRSGARWSGVEWLALLPDPRPSPEEHSVQASEARAWRQRLAEALAALPPRERLIISRRHLAEATLSFAAIARELGLSKERVRQLEAQAMGELRRIVGAAGTPAPVLGGE